MKKMNRLTEIETRLANGGRRYRCNVCGYTNFSYFRVISHCFFHYWKAGIRVFN